MGSACLLGKNLEKKEVSARSGAPFARTPTPQMARPFLRLLSFVPLSFYFKRSFRD